MSSTVNKGNGLPSGRTASATKSTLLYSSASMIALLVAAPVGAQQVINDGDNVTVTSAADGETISAAAGVTSTVAGAPVVVVANNDVTLDNAGTLATTGVTQTVQVNQGTTGATINNAVTGTILADSRAVNFDGSDATLNNDGVILGTGDQRNGAVYANRTSNNITINNSATGSIDAGMGNDGAGVAIEVGGGGAPRGGAITNAGIIQGRGQAAPTGGTAGDGIRFFGPGLAPEYVYEGDITNSGLINSESTQGTVAGVRFANRIGFQGTLTNEAAGTISGAQNGLYFGNDADHTGGVVNNLGTISSDSRALNIDGTGLVINNSGSILGTASQRNGTVYADSTAQDFTLNNEATGVIDAGMGNEGAGFSVELASAADGGNTFDIVNAGTIQGRGNAGAGAAAAGDGLRFERTRVAGMLDGTTDGLFIGNITNSGTIDSEAANGTAAGIRFVNGVSFQGVLENSGTISGVQNGLYFGNPTPAGGGDFSQAIVNNSGTISSGSRAFNIDGTGLTVNNLTTGEIIGTGDQRNGTLYADGTATDFTVNNAGTIDAGMGNIGSGFAAEIAAAGNTFTFDNSGTVQGRGQGDAATGAAGDGFRIGNVGNSGLATIDITNSGLIDSESLVGTTAGLRIVNGISAAGTITNTEGGTISGAQNGLYLGNATPAGGGDFSALTIDNAGTIFSGSRALNIDGTGVTVNNLATGQIVGTGNQRNGTVYADSTAQDFTFDNAGTVDAGMGNEGSGFGAEIAADGNTFDLVNSGTIQGRGQASAAVNAAGDGVRIGNVGNIGVFDGTITNSGLINSESTQGTTAGIRFVNGISFQGTLTNEEGGTISGAQNGLYFGNPVMGEGADHTGGVVNNAGIISSDSRALNIDGLGLVVNNLATGQIIGTGNQRNGTVYADGTADDFTFDNAGTVDAGMGNTGSGFGAEIGDAADGANTFTLINAGTIQGRGDAPAGENAAGDGVRIGNVGNIGLAELTAVNSGLIASEGANGTVAGVRFVNGISFAGTFDNSGTITGVQNGVYFGNPVMGEGADHSNGVFNNLEGGVISSDSRAFNIDGLGLTVNNAGSILGTANQRNGTVYADGTADNFTFTNSGTIDAGMGNEGSGFGVEVGDAADMANTFTLTNTGTIQGRGQAAAGTNGAGDGVRIGNVGNTGLVEATIVNSGTINSESTQMTTAGLRVVNGVNFQGSITNSGTISGGNHGIYLGAGDHTGATFTNSGTLSGGVNAFFAGNALSAVNFTNDGGTLVGNFVGTAFEDTLSITGTGNSIQGDILNNVAVTTAADSTTVFSGVRSLSGSLTNAGTLNFDLNVDSLAVDGDAVLTSGSVINIATTGVSQADLGQTIDVLTETGTFTNDGATINVLDDDFLIDYQVVLGSVAVTASATDLGAVSADGNINSFGSAITSAATNNRLSGDVFTALNALSSATQFEAAALDLLPAVNPAVTREIFETQRFVSTQVQDRLTGEGIGLWGEAFYRDANADAESLSTRGYDAEATGFTLGLDGRINETTVVGVFANYSDIDIDNDGTSASGSKADAFQFGAYAGFDLGQAFVNAELGYSTSSVDETRSALGSSITSDSDVDGVFASLNAGYDLGTDAIAITPTVGLRYAGLSRDTFTENGGLGLTLDSESAEFLEGRVGIRVASKAETGFVPYASVDYAYDFSSDPLAIAGSFNGGADSFTVVSDEASASRFDVSVGADFISEGNLSIGAQYRGRFASGYQSHTGGLRVRFAF